MEANDGQCLNLVSFGASNLECRCIDSPGQDDSPSQAPSHHYWYWIYYSGKLEYRQVALEWTPPGKIKRRKLIGTWRRRGSWSERSGLSSAGLPKPVPAGEDSLTLYAPGGAKKIKYVKYCEVNKDGVNGYRVREHVQLEERINIQHWVLFMPCLSVVALVRLGISRHGRRRR